MLSYQHRYHAGNFADVHKHLTLIALIEKLQQKPSAIRILDTHAGEGLYDLDTREALKNREFDEGVLKIKDTLESKTLSPPKLIQDYQAILNQFSQKKYPGSPCISAALLRQIDKLTAIEKHPAAFQALTRALGKNKNTYLHHRDAYESLNGLLPFPEKRGIILIDPSYEIKAEFKWVATAIETVFQKFSQGVYMIWYPILIDGYHQDLLKNLQKLMLPKVTISEWFLKSVPTVTSQLLGSGIITINTPFELEATLKTTFDWLNTHIFTERTYKKK